MKRIIISTAAQANKIKFLPFNRDYKVRKDLVDKMQSYGFIVPIIIIETDVITGVMERYIADGQNRFVTARFLDIPIEAMVLTNKFVTQAELVEFVASLNSTHKSWDTIDYVNAYAYLGRKEYITLNKMFNNSFYTLHTVAAILHGFKSRGRVSKLVESGDFVCSYAKEAQETLDYAIKLSQYGQLTNRMIIALHFVFHLKTFNEKKFTARYKKEYLKIRITGLDDFSAIFSSWLN